jgi:8-oxo-dGTP diphosphatase
VTQLNAAGEVRSAGGVATRHGADGALEVLLVHRGHYDDWTIPKGKAEEGESDEACALREVEEETGLRGRLGDELPSVRWRDRFDRPKVARYWLFVPFDAAEATASNEIDDVAWLSIDAAIARLTYGRDAEVLVAVARAGKTPP